MFKKPLLITCFQWVLPAVFAVLMLIPGQSHATHLAALDVGYTHVSGNTYKFRVVVYRDCKGVDLSNTQIITVTSASCFKSFDVQLPLVSLEEVSPVCDSLAGETYCNGGNFPGYEKYVFEAEHDIPYQCADWRISYSLCARNVAITNINDPGNECAYVYATLDNTSQHNSSVNLAATPVVYACQGSLFQFNQGASDPDGDSLVFSLIKPMSTQNTTVTFLNPQNETYPVSDIRGFNNFDNKTGTLGFIAQGTQIAVASVRIDEYRDGVLIGSVMRDMQFIVLSTSCNNAQPMDTTGINLVSGGFLLDSNVLSGCPGTELIFDLEFIDADAGDSITLTDNIQDALPGAQITYAGSNPVQVHIEWTPTQFGSHFIEARLKDNFCPIAAVNGYGYTIDINPIGFSLDSAICTTGSVTLSANGLSTIWWANIDQPEDTLGTGPTLNVTPGTTIGQQDIYIATEFGKSIGCNSEISYGIEPYIPLNLTLNAQDTTCNFAPVVLDLNVLPQSNVLTYSWSPAYGLNDSTLQRPTASVYSDADYKVVVSTPSGCVMDSAQISLRINPGLVTGSKLTLDSPLICKGDTIGLDIEVQQKIYEATFDPDTLSGFWDEIVGGTISNGCGNTTGNGLLFDGPVRKATTAPLDVNQNTLLRFSITYPDGTTSPCEQAQPNEAISVYFSFNGGAQWIPFYTVFPNPAGGTEWYEVSLPFAAKTDHTMFRWEQSNFNEPNGDNWILDNIVFSQVNNDGITVEWQPVAYIDSVDVLSADYFPDTTSYLTYVLHDSISSCPFTVDTFVTISFPFDITSINPDTSLCEEVGLQLYANVDGRNDISYHWTPEMGVTSPNSAVTYAVSESSTPYYVTATSADQCFSVTDTVNVYISRFQNSVEVWADTTRLCPGDFTNAYVAIDPVCGTFGNMCDSVKEITTNTSNLSPTDSYKVTPFAATGGKSMRHQYILSKANLNYWGMTGPSNISSLSFRVDTLFGSGLYTNFQISMKCVDKAYFSAGDDFEDGLSTVFDPQTIYVTNGWFTLDFNHTYTWDGESSIVINVCYDNNHGTISSYVASASFPNAVTLYSSLWGCDPGNTFIWARMPIMKFEFCDATTSDSLQYEWLPNTGVLSSNNNQAQLEFQSDAIEYTAWVTDLKSKCKYYNYLSLNPYPTDYNVKALDSVLCDFNNVPVYAEHDFDSGYSVQWSPAGFVSDPASDHTTIIGGSVQTPFVVSITDKYNCITLTDTTNLSLSTFDPDLPDDTTLCVGENVVIQKATGYQYSWLPTSGVTTPTATSFVIQPDSTTQYELSVTDTIGCVFYDSLQIGVIRKPEPELYGIEPLCEGDTFNIRAVGEWIDGLEWSDGSTDSVRNFTEAGAYFVAFYNQCDTVPETFTLNYSSGSVDLSGDSSLCHQPSTVLTVNSVVNTGPFEHLHWYREGTLIDSSVSSLEVFQEGVYLVEWIDSLNCIYSDSIHVTMGSEDFFIPTAFTPDADQKNDIWHIEGLDCFDEVNVTVFNRWGNIVFEGRNDWDGSGLPSASYFFTLEIPEAPDMNQSGTVTIVR